MSKQAPVQEITDVVSYEGIKKLRVGEVLGFVDPDGKRTDIKITRMTKFRVWGREIETHLPEEVIVAETKKGKRTSRKLG